MVAFKDKRPAGEQRKVHPAPLSRARSTNPVLFPVHAKDCSREIESEAVRCRFNREKDDRDYLPSGKKFGKTYLTNKLNYIHFSNAAILINFRHTRYGNTVSYEATPRPCLGNTLECVWVGPDNPSEKLADYEFINALLPEGQTLLLLEPEGVTLLEDRIRFQLPDTCSDVGTRKVKRNLCKDIQASLSQNGAVFDGSLVDFSAISLRIAVAATPPQTFQWIDPEAAVTIRLTDKDRMLYLGDCRIVKQEGGRSERHYIVEPLYDQIKRFKKREYRNLRQKLTPSPHVILRHPLTGKVSSLDVIDIAGSGFSVVEQEDNAVLLPGLFVPDMELHIAESFAAPCQAQVIYKTAMPGKNHDHYIKCGLVLIDMHPQDHRKLVSLLYQAANNNSYLCNTIEMDDLWQFFFETGFIYPEKYEFFQRNKERIQETYRKLYSEHTEMARHFIYQDKGRILGHMAMLRFHNRSWLIHHHAARKNGGTVAGLAVLNQIGTYMYDAHRLYSMRMDFAFCYYRPDNKFPARVFGGAVRSINDPKGCSLDTFSYFYFRRLPFLEPKIANPWSLVPADGADIAELKQYYEYTSGGLMISAFDLEPDCEDIDELVETYQQAGLKRARFLLSLKKENTLVALLMVNIADIGLNLSELTNSIMAIVLVPDELPADILYAALSGAIQKTGQEEMAVLLYPDSYRAHYPAAPPMKAYNLWIIDTKYSDRYFSYTQKITKRINGLKTNRALAGGYKRKAAGTL